MPANKHTQTEEKPIRFVLASFTIEGANIDLRGPFKAEFEGQLFNNVIGICPNYLAYIPDDQTEAVEYVNGIDAQMRREYGILNDRLAVPSRGNYLIFVKINSDNNGTFAKIGIYEYLNGQPTYVANGYYLSSLAINSFYHPGNRKELIQHAIEETLTEKRLRIWITKQTPDGKILPPCFEGERISKKSIQRKDRNKQEGPEESLIVLDPQCKERHIGNLIIINDRDDYVGFEIRYQGEYSSAYVWETVQRINYDGILEDVQIEKYYRNTIWLKRMLAPGEHMVVYDLAAGTFEVNADISDDGKFPRRMSLSKKPFTYDKPLHRELYPPIGQFIKNKQLKVPECQIGRYRFES